MVSTCYYWFKLVDKIQQDNLNHMYYYSKLNKESQHIEYTELLLHHYINNKYYCKVHMYCHILFQDFNRNLICQYFNIKNQLYLKNLFHCILYIQQVTLYNCNIIMYHKASMFKQQSMLLKFQQLDQDYYNMEWHNFKHIIHQTMLMKQAIRRIQINNLNTLLVNYYYNCNNLQHSLHKYFHKFSLVSHYLFNNIKLDNLLHIKLNYYLMYLCINRHFLYKVCNH